MRGRSLFLAAAFTAACGSSQFTGDNGDGGTVDPTGGDDGGADAAADANVPSTPSPASVTFVDQDPTKGSIQGDVKIARASDESNVTTYALYWSQDGKTKVGAAVAHIAKSGGDLTYTFAAATTAPDYANFLLAFAANDSGEFPGFAATAGDNHPRYDDLSKVTVTQPNAFSFPIFVESATSQLGALTLSETVLCPLPNGACTQTATTFASLNGLGGLSDATFDATSQKILGVADISPGVTQLLSCKADGTGCAQTSLDSSLSGTGNTAMVVDDVGGKLYIFTYNGTSAVTVCNHDGSGCTFHQVTANGGPTGKYGRARMAIDTASQRLDIAVTDFTGGLTQLGLLQCSLSFGVSDACQITTLSTASDSGHTPSIVIDSKAGKILVVTDYQTGGAGSASLYRCDLMASNCSARIDLSASAGVGMGVDEYPSAVIDPDGNHLYVGASNSNTNTPTMYRCNPDGTACTTAALADTSGGGGSPTLRFDVTTHRNYFAYQATAGTVFGAIAPW